MFCRLFLKDVEEIMELRGDDLSDVSFWLLMLFSNLGRLGLGSGNFIRCWNQSESSMNIAMFASESVRSSVDLLDVGGVDVRGSVLFFVLDGDRVVSLLLRSSRDTRGCCCDALNVGLVGKARA